MIRVASIRLTDLLSLAASSLRRNRLRSFLTIGAIAFSIAVMQYLISFGLGLEQLTLGSIMRSASLLSITVTSGSEELQPLDQKALQKIAAIPHLSTVLPKLTVKGDVGLENQKTGATIVGVDPEYLASSSETAITVGDYYQKDDSRVMVVTTGFLKLFGLNDSKTPQLLFNVQLDSEKYASIAPVENVSVAGVVNSESVVAYVPLSYMQELLGEQAPSYEDVKVQPDSLDTLQSVSDGLIAQGFKVVKVVDTIDEVKKVFFWIQAIMITLGVIAVVVASIGMFNTLTVSLLERTREIGIMKALGVKRSDIGRLFITEALLMGAIGGILGIALSFLFQQITMLVLSLLATLAQGVVPELFLNQWHILAGFLLFALIISGLTGLYPARRAVRINPIDAIRYE